MMSITITLPEPLTHLLEQQATRLHLSSEALAVKLISAALIDEATALLERNWKDQEFPSLEEIVAGIKALPPNPKSFHPAERAHDLSYLTWLLENPTEGTMTVEEWEQFWPPFEQELKEIDRLDDLNEGRI